jgi:hypothetical protein
MRAAVRARLKAGTVWLSAAAVAGIAITALTTTPAQASGAPPSFVQQVTAHHANVASTAVTPAAAITAGNRLVVEVGVWNAKSATAGAVTDSAGDVYTELTHFTASDHTELSVWSAPITAGGGTTPTVTAKVTSAADIGVAVLEYSGLAAAADASIVDVQAHASGTTSAAGIVASGASAATSAGNGLALGFYADSGFRDSLSPGTGFTARASVSTASDMELLVEDQAAAQGATPNASFGTGANTVWLAAIVVLKAASSGTAPTVPGTPSTVVATAGNASATVFWTAPADGGSTITSYTITPYAAGAAQASTTVTGTPPQASALIAGLANGTSYTFTVTATNAIGTSSASAPSNAVVPGPSPLGQWGPLTTSPMVSIHTVLLNNGKLLQWDGWKTPEPTYLYDPTAGTYTEITAPSSIFCGGNAKLPDGRVLVVGGFGVGVTGMLGIVDTNVFDPATQTWTRMANMHLPRWYPDLTELPDGRYVAISGNSTDSSTWADTPEVYDPSTNTWTLLPGISTSQVHEQEYPFSYLAPNGKIFTIGPSEDVSYWLDPNAQTWTPVGASGVVNGSPVMYLPGKILYSGGSANVTSGTPSQTNTSIIDLTAPTPAWHAIAPMNYARDYHTLTMLADGRVLAVGGGQTSDQMQITSGVLPAEIWDPATQQWTTIGSIAAARNYHSTAVLQPDGTVLVSGGGHPETLNDPGEFSAQVYSPSYLFNGPRPTITAAPATAQYGSTMAVSTPDAANIGAANLVSFGADTHQSDMDQHFVPLSFTAGSGSLTIQAPASGAIAPPGDYMLFIVNKSGVPSVAATVHITAAPPTAPVAPTGVTAVAGNGSASVTWTAPANGGSPITSYTVTPYAGTTALPSTTVTGTPPAPAATVSGLTNGTSYTFTVTATNAVGTSPASNASNAVTPTTVITPAFVQQASTHRAGVSSASVSLGTPVTVGNRVVVEVGVWSSGSATANGVTDSAGNTYTELTHFTASDHTELSVWSAPITAGAGAALSVTASTTGTGDIAVASLEYSGLSVVAGTGALDVQAHATGKSTAAATLASGPTTAVDSGSELALGFYADSGFGDTLSAGSGFVSRANISNTSDMELLAEDQSAAQGSTPSATFGSSAATTWLAAVLVFKHG